jgi:hypothetical protein
MLILARPEQTETILRTENLCFSYVQTRGSVPRQYLLFLPDLILANARRFP